MAEDLVYWVKAFRGEMVSVPEESLEKWAKKQEELKKTWTPEMEAERDRKIAASVEKAKRL